MIAKKKKIEPKSLINQKRSSRRLLTFYRICRYGFDSFIRNSWLTIAATAVMVITLLIIFTAVVAQKVMTDTVSLLSDKVNMSIYLKTDTSDKDGSELVSELKKLSSVRSAEFISSAKAMSDLAKENSDDPAFLSAIKEASNKTPATIRVAVKNINDTNELEKFVEENDLVSKHINPDFKPSFAGERRDIIKSIGRVVSFIQKVGIIVGILFVIISSLIIFNTIRMAIFNRKEEIQMMQLIGADRFFIRGPFLIESIFYGIIAAFIATGIGVFGLSKVAPILKSYQINIQPTLDYMADYHLALILLAMIIIGSIIGIISSILATHRYLKL